MAAAPHHRRPDMDDFDKITLTEIGHRFKYDTRGTIDWCRQNGLLESRFHCEVCIDAQGNLDTECNMGNLRNKIDGECFRWPSCRKIYSIRKGSYFERSHLKLWQILGLTYIWCENAGRSCGLPVNVAMEELEIGSNKTIIDWNQYCRDVPVTFCQPSR